MTKNIEIIQVGALPPPVRGMPLVNQWVHDQFCKEGFKLLHINLAAPGLGRGLLTRLARLPKVLKGLALLTFKDHTPGSVLYLSVSGGLGQIYDIMFVLIARLRGMRIFLHHHSFSYLARHNWLSHGLIQVAGRSAMHVVQCPVMAERLRQEYHVDKVAAVSNAVLVEAHRGRTRRQFKGFFKLGYLSNISQSKGVFDFLDLIKETETCELPVKGLLAGPFESRDVERKVHNYLLEIDNVQYIGEVFGRKKRAFFEQIDIFVFPTRYPNETEGIVNLESLSYGVPVIAYGRGCIPDIVGNQCGLVIAPTEPFVPKAREQIKAWLDNPAEFEKASRAALQRFAEIRSENLARWREVLNEIASPTSSLKQ